MRLEVETASVVVKIMTVLLYIVSTLIALCAYSVRGCGGSMKGVSMETHQTLHVLPRV